MMAWFNWNLILSEKLNEGADTSLLHTGRYRIYLCPPPSIVYMYKKIDSVKNGGAEPIWYLFRFIQETIYGITHFNDG